jgi:hypothetical protein
MELSGLKQPPWFIGQIAVQLQCDRVGKHLAGIWVNGGGGKSQEATFTYGKVGEVMRDGRMHERGTILWNTTGSSWGGFGLVVFSRTLCSPLQLVGGGLQTILIVCCMVSASPGAYAA